MTYRDDHDAAIARADALEAELRDAQAEHQRDEARIARLEAELAKRPPVERPKPPAPRPASSEDAPRRPNRLPIILGATVGVVAIAGVVVALVIRHVDDRAQVAAGWDVQHYLELATAEARNKWSDAELTKINADYVDSSGKAQLTVSGARLSFYFRSPSRVSPPPPPPRLGMPAKTVSDECELRERIYKQSTSLTQDTYTSSDGCGTSVPGPTRCSIVEIWQRAIAKGAPSSAVAAITLRTENGKRRWRFEIANAMPAVSFADDCH